MFVRLRRRDAEGGMSIGMGADIDRFDAVVGQDPGWSCDRAAALASSVSQKARSDAPGSAARHRVCSSPIVPQPMIARVTVDAMTLRS
jgi:hypothetical protein